jgi:hypothetical protein
VQHQPRTAHDPPGSRIPTGSLNIKGFQQGT